MTTEELIALGLTEEQANNVFALHGKGIASLQNKVKTLEADSAELKNLKQSQMTDEQKRQQAIDDANKMKSDYQKKMNKLDVEKIFLNAGMKEEDYKDFIDGIVTDDAETSKNIATAMANTFKAKIEAASEQAKNDALKGTQKPAAEGGEGSDGGRQKSEEELFVEELINDGSNKASKAAKDALSYYGGGN